MAFLRKKKYLSSLKKRSTIDYILVYLDDKTFYGAAYENIYSIIDATGKVSRLKETDTVEVFDLHGSIDKDIKNTLRMSYGLKQLK